MIEAENITIGRFVNDTKASCKSIPSERQLTVSSKNAPQEYPAGSLTRLAEPRSTINESS